MVFKKKIDELKEQFSKEVEGEMNKAKQEVKKDSELVEKAVVSLEEFKKRIFDTPEEGDIVIEGKTDVDFVTGIWENEHQRRSVKALILLRDRIKELEKDNAVLELRLEREKLKTKEIVENQKQKLEKLLEE